MLADSGLWAIKSYDVNVEVSFFEPYSQAAVRRFELGDKRKCIWRLLYIRAMAKQLSVSGQKLRKKLPEVPSIPFHLYLPV
jgi:hypothetical protein